MKKFKIIIRLVLIGLITCIFVACSNTNEQVKDTEKGIANENATQSSTEAKTVDSQETTTQDENTQDNSTQVLNTISQQLNENLTADAKIDLPESFNGEVKIINTVLKKLDTDKVLATLMPDEEVEQPAEGVYLSDDKNLNIGNSLNFSTQNSLYYTSVYSPEKCAENAELPFMKIDKAYQEVVNTLKEIGFENITLNHVYTMDVNLMKQEDKIKSEDENFDEDLKNGRALYKGEWSEDDGCYVFELKQSYNDMAILDNAYVTADDTCVFGGKVRVFYTKNGVEAINIDAIYDKVDEEDATEAIDPNKALDLLKRKYDTIIMTDKMVVSNMKITYIPVLSDKDGGKFQLVPAWDLTIIPQEKENASEEYHVYFNAITGEEFLI